MNCKTCNTLLTSKYCPNCGQPAELKRINLQYVVHEIEHVLHFERGILYTIRELVVNPGQNVKRYLTENRNRLVKPIIFIIITSLIYSLSNGFFHFEDGYVNYVDNNNSTASSIFRWIQGHYGYANIIMAIFIAACVKIFFIKYDYNIFEILILLCFTMGIGMLIFSIFGIAQSLTNVKLMSIAGIVGFLYTAWAIGLFYDRAKIMSYIKALLAYLMGMILFSISAIVLGLIIDSVIKN